MARRSHYMMLNIFLPQKVITKESVYINEKSKYNTM